jgi:hypothetical protein
MKYILLFVGDDTVEPTAPEMAEMYEAVGAWWGEHAQAGHIVGGHQLQPSRTATTINRGNGTPVVTDGPFMEAKEAIAGYAILDVPDLDAAINVARTWPWGSKVEIRPILEQP